MAKNLIPQIAELLGVELGEEFKIKGDCRTYWFDLDGLHSGYHVARYETDVTLRALLCGDKEIIKLPWKPKNGEFVWTFLVLPKLHVARMEYQNGQIECLALHKAGWLFRTRAEAEAALPVVAAELGVEYDL